MAMGDRFDIEERWPELFEGLDDKQRWSIRQALASAWHEGWVPNREDVALITAEARGEIDFDEYLRQVAEVAKQRAESHDTAQ